jgi:hypothetical protein
MLIEILKTLGLLGLVCLALAILKHFYALSKIRFYTSQGMRVCPGYDTFFIGNVKQMINWRRIRVANQGKYGQAHPKITLCKQELTSQLGPSSVGSQTRSTLKNQKITMILRLTRLSS